MTLEELYGEIGGNYQHAVQIMKMDKMICKYLLKFKNAGLCESLMAAGENMQQNELFDAAHAMKGVCANLGLDSLAAAAGDVTEEFRPGSSRSMSDEEVRAKLDEIRAMYEKTIKGISEYEAGL